MRFNADYKKTAPAVINTKSILGHTYTLTDEYLLKDGEPYIYTMGEFHFSRYNENDWERELKKMKDGGIDIVASYLFWNHHETEEGIFDFTGNRNLRRFIDLCGELGMPFFLRIGPWAHGEARLGGFPDWLEGQCGETRSLDEKYLFYAERYFREVYKQVSSCGSIIGIQIENEYSGGREYLQRLYELVKNIGFDALIFTATGWDNAVLPDSLFPVFGGYPEHPWAQDTEVFNDAGFYGFSPHDAVKYRERTGQTRKFPVFTCELGGGNQSTYHRRPLIKPWEVASLTVVQLGTGAKGLGYYMYHGGINPVSCRNGELLSGFQERRESGYPNDCPVVSYDFQSPLGDFGQYRQSYFELKNLLSFVKHEGGRLAVMKNFSDEDMPADDNLAPLRAAVLSDGESGFLLYINCLHGHKLPEKKDTAHIRTATGEISVPLTAAPDSFGVIPFNYPVGGEVLRWVKAVPVSEAENEITFCALKGMKPEYMKADGLKGVLTDGMTLGGITVRLTELHYPVRKRSNPLKATECEKRLAFGIFGHIIPEENRRLPDLSKEYSVEIPEDTDYVCICAEGNLGAAFSEENGEFRLISDHFLDGDEWIADVRGVKKLRLKIQPFTAEDEKGVYLEKKFVTGHFVPQVFPLGKEVFVNTPASE